MTSNQPSSANIRRFLFDFFSNEELATLCFDYFPEVDKNFASDMTKGAMILQLIGYCQRHEKIPELLVALQRARPEQYEKQLSQTHKATWGRVRRLPVLAWVGIGAALLLVGIISFRVFRDGAKPSVLPTGTMPFKSAGSLAPNLTQTPQPPDTPIVTRVSPATSSAISSISSVTLVVSNTATAISANMTSTPKPILAAIATSTPTPISTAMLSKPPVPSTRTMTLTIAPSPIPTTQLLPPSTETPPPISANKPICRAKFECVLEKIAAGQVCTDTITLPPTTVSVILIEMTEKREPNYGFGYSLWEISLFNGEGLAPGSKDGKGAIATASSSQDSSHVPKCAIDDLPTTRWGSAHAEPRSWFTVTLGAPVLIDRIELKWEDAYAKNYCVIIK